MHYHVLMYVEQRLTLIQDTFRNSDQDGKENFYFDPLYNWIYKVFKIKNKFYIYILHKNSDILFHLNIIIQQVSLTCQENKSKMLTFYWIINNK